MFKACVPPLRGFKIYDQRLPTAYAVGYGCVAPAGHLQTAKMFFLMSRRDKMEECMNRQRRLRTGKGMKRRRKDPV